MRFVHFVPRDFVYFRIFSYQPFHEFCTTFMYDVLFSCHGRSTNGMKTYDSQTMVYPTKTYSPLLLITYLETPCSMITSAECSLKLYILHVMHILHMYICTARPGYVFQNPQPGTARPGPDLCPARLQLWLTYLDRLYRPCGSSSRLYVDRTRHENWA